MSATLPVTVQDMQDQNVVMRMLRNRLIGMTESDSMICGKMPFAAPKYVQGGNLSMSYNKQTGVFRFDNDWLEKTENRLKELYQFEEAKIEAEAMGCPYTEVINPNTGEITLAIDDAAPQFNQLAQEAV